MWKNFGEQNLKKNLEKMLRVQNLKTNFKEKNSTKNN